MNPKSIRPGRKRDTASIPPAKASLHAAGGKRKTGSASPKHPRPGGTAFESAPPSITHFQVYGLLFP